MSDRAHLLDLLRTSGDALVAAVRDLDDAQLRFKPAPDRWSIAENAEHLAVVEHGSGRLLRGRLTREPTPPEVLAATAGAEVRIDARLVPRDQAFAAPEFVLPAGRWQTAGEILAVFSESRREIVAFLESSPLDLDAYAAPHPIFGPLTGWQWARFLGLHCVRHVGQIEDVKRTPGYPG